ncbi:hypothetical protein [Clostridium sp.]|uniref:hypothetical protein n=1 Tax=Clostridium sp. TaxID=1506 RepID=UPI002610956F|nr:hypothetical protein [uncultured Clostridium sp.]
MDSDGHNILNDRGEITNKSKEVYISNHIWICLGVSVFKGSEKGNVSIIAANSTVLGKYGKDNCIIGGNPAKIIKENINLGK